MFLVIAKECTMGANSMLIGDADDIHEYFMGRAERVFAGGLAKQLVLLFVEGGLTRGQWFIEQQKDGSVEWEDLNFFFPEDGGTETADEHVLPGVDDLLQTRLAYIVGAVWQLSGELSHCEVVEALAAFATCRH